MTKGALPRPHRSCARPADVIAWDTRDPMPAGFREAWNEALSSTTHGHFAYSLDYLAWKNECGGRRSRALLLEGGGRRAVAIQHRAPRRWISGWPWRRQALICGSDPDDPVGMSPADSAWIHRAISHFTGAEASVTYLPCPPERGLLGWPAGATLIQDIGRPDDELLAGMAASKRRLVRRALRNPVEIRPARCESEFQAFFELQQEVWARLGLPCDPVPQRRPAPGQAWREWELPWMWLLLACRDGQVLAGLGDGVLAGGTLQGRAAATTAEARREGVSVLLGYEEMRQGRDLGHRWLNYGGDTPFKREMCGRLGHRVEMFAWPGGDPWQRFWQFGAVALRAMTPKLARLRRRIWPAACLLLTTALAACVAAAVPDVASADGMLADGPLDAFADQVAWARLHFDARP